MSGKEEGDFGGALAYNGNTICWVQGHRGWGGKEKSRVVRSSDKVYGQWNKLMWGCGNSGTMVMDTDGISKGYQWGIKCLSSSCHGILCHQSYKPIVQRHSAKVGNMAMYIGPVQRICPYQWYLFPFFHKQHITDIVININFENGILK